MIKKAYNILFTKQTGFDRFKDLWNGTTLRLGKNVSVFTADDMPVSEIHPDNALTEFENKTGKPPHSFQEILAKSL